MRFSPAPLPEGSIGFILPTFPQEGDPWATAARRGVDPMVELAGWSRAAEDLGAAGLWACDHLFWHRPSLECLTSLTVAATAATRAALGSCVLQLPLRQPAAVAKQASTLQVLSGGRFVLGVGVGRHPVEYDRVGVDFHRRGALLERGIAELRRCWSPGGETGMATGSGDAGYDQRPVADVPIWIGGSSVAARRRAAASADGWAPLFLGVDEYAEAIGELAADCDRAGRPAGSVTPAMVLFVSVDDDGAEARRRGTAWLSSFYGLPAARFDRHLVAGAPDEVARVVDAYWEAGAAHVVLYVTDDRPLDQFERLMAATPVRAGVGG